MFFQHTFGSFDKFASAKFSFDCKVQELLFLAPLKQSETFYFGSFTLKRSECFIFFKSVSGAGVFVSTNIYGDLAFKGGFQ